jgi:hypothetical protein
MAADFFVVPTATGRLFFVLVVLAHQRRRVVHVASQNIRRRHGSRNNFEKPFHGTMRRGI